jgi:hypothetical protein
MRNFLDSVILLIVNVRLYLMHPIWFGRTALRLRRLPNVAVPKSFREKRMWRLIFDRNPLFVMFGDKLATKVWMTDRAPALTSVPTIWVANNADEIPENFFASEVVIKANRGCNQNIFLDHTSYSRDEILNTLHQWLKNTHREKHGRKYWPQLQQKIFAETVIPSDPGALLDFNLFCCDGKVLFTVVTVGEKTGEEKIAYFSPSGERILAIQNIRSYMRNWLPLDFALPQCFGQAVQAAALLTQSIDFVRVDIMCANETLYACEMTPFPSVGAYMQTAFVEAHMQAWDLEKSWFMQTGQTAFTQAYQQALRRHLSPKAQST